MEGKEKNKGGGFSRRTVAIQLGRQAICGSGRENSQVTVTTLTFVVQCVNVVGVLRLCFDSKVDNCYSASSFGASCI